MEKCQKIAGGFDSHCRKKRSYGAISERINEPTGKHDGAHRRRRLGQSAPSKKSGKYFSGNYYIKFGHFSGKNHVKCRHFVNFS